MRIGIGCDLPGFGLKQALVQFLESKGHDVTDVGCHTEEIVDYPDFAKEVGEGVAGGRFDRGILICGTGQGMNIAANKVRGVRAALCYDTLPAILSREHNDSNVLCTGAWLIAEEKAKEMVQAWLGAKFQNPYHANRLQKIQLMEE